MDGVTATAAPGGRRCDLSTMVGLEWSPDSTPARRWCVGILAVVALGFLIALVGLPLAVGGVIVTMVEHNRSKGTAE